MASAIARLSVSAAAILLVLTSAWWLWDGRTDPAVPDTISIRLNNTDIMVQIARTNEEKIRGLSGHATLADSEGMFFISDYDDFHPIWMKGMLFSIDILWLSVDGRVVDIKENAAPESYPEIFMSREPARFVLEVPAGFTARHDVNIGARAILPFGVY
ncbi:MAG: DUF192 domain-containing protein [Candidatus Niyogibacteria bacterium]|nr:DUF192 domain-containing protein [Candidatus Niyogibacteria bacterium]